MIKRVLTVATLILAFAACGKGKEEVTPEKEVVKKAVKTIVLEEEALSKRIEGAATLEAKYRAKQTSPGGEVVKKNYKNGDRVEKDDVILVLDDDNIESNYISAEANYLNARAQYEKAQKFAELEVRNGLTQAKANYVNAEETLNKAIRGGNEEQVAISKSAFEAATIALEQASSSLEKNTKLYNDNLISEDQFLAVKTSYNQANAQYNQAKYNLELLERGADSEDVNILKASLELAKSALAIAEKSVAEKTWEYNIQAAKTQYMAAKEQFRLAKKSNDELEVKAKTAGLVTNLDWEVFDEVENKDVLFTVVDDKEMEFSIGINAKDIVFIGEGNKVEVEVKELNKVFEGRVEEVNPSADTADRKYMVKGIVDNVDGVLKNGMYITATVVGNQKETIGVPKEAIVVKGLYKYVYVIENGKAKKITVELGDDYGDKVEVITDEIKAGQKLVVEGQFLLEDNDNVKEVK